MDIEFWLKVLEGSSAILALLCSYLGTRGNSGSWIIGAIAAIEASAVFYIKDLPAQAGLQWFFVGSSVYGFIQWQGHRSSNEELLISKMNLKGWVFQLALTGLAYLIIQYILIPATYHDANWLDSLTTALSLWGTYTMARRKYECWQIWILVNALLTALTITTGLWLFAIQYFALLIISVKGYIHWTDLYALQIEKK